MKCRALIFFQGNIYLLKPVTSLAFKHYECLISKPMSFNAFDGGIPGALTWPVDCKIRQISDRGRLYEIVCRHPVCRLLHKSLCWSSRIHAVVSHSSYWDSSCKASHHSVVRPALLSVRHSAGAPSWDHGMRERGSCSSAVPSRFASLGRMTTTT